MFKDTVITSNQKKRELLIIVLCFAAAFVFNIIGIIIYKSPAKELFTQLHIVLILAAFFYLLTLLARGLYLVVKALIKYVSKSL